MNIDLGEIPVEIRIEEKIGKRKKKGFVFIIELSLYIFISG